MSNTARFGDGAVAPLGSLLIVEHGRDGRPLIGVGSPQPVVGVGSDAVEDGVALRAAVDFTLGTSDAELVVCVPAVEPVSLAVVEDNEGRQRGPVADGVAVLGDRIDVDLGPLREGAVSAAAPETGWLLVIPGDPLFAIKVLNTPEFSGNAPLT